MLTRPNDTQTKKLSGIIVFVCSVATCIVACLLFQAHKSNNSKHSIASPLSSVPTMLAARTLVGYKDFILRCQFAPDGKTLATLDMGGSITCWDVKTWEEIRKIHLSKSIMGMCYSPDSRCIAISGENMPVTLLDAASGRISKKMNRNTEFAQKLIYSPDGRTILTGGVTDSVIVWSVLSGEKVKMLSDDLNVRAIAFFPNGKLLARGSLNNNIDILDAKSWQKLAVLNGHCDSIACLSCSPDGKLLVSGGEDNDVVVWNIPQYTQKFRFAHQGAAVKAVVFSPSGKYIISGGEYCVKVWDVQTGELKSILKGPQEVIYDIAISPDGKTIVACGTDKIVYVWEAPK